MPGTLADVARNDRRGCAQAGQKLFQALDLLEIGEAAEVKIGNVGDDDTRLGSLRCRHRRWAHKITRILYVSTASPRAVPCTRNRVMVEQTFSGDTELATTLLSPARSSCTSIVVALSVAFLRVT